MLRGSRRVPGPAVLLPVGAVRGEVVEIGQVAAPSYLAYPVGRLVGAGKAPTLLQVRAQDKVGQEALCGLLLCDAGDVEVAEAVVGEHGLEDFLFLAAQDIDVALGVAVRIEIDVVVVRFPVQQLLAALDVYALPGRAFDLQAEDACVVLAEVIDISAASLRRFLRSVLPEQAVIDIRPGLVRRHLAGVDFYRGDLLCDDDVVCIA